MKIKIIYSISLIAVLSFTAFLLSGKITDNSGSLKASFIEHGFDRPGETEFVPNKEEPQGLAEENDEFEGKPLNEFTVDINKTEELWNNINNMPNEKDLGTDAVNPWVAIGPYGSVTDRTSRFCGRILDIEIQSSGNIRVGAASGGLWESTNSLPVPLSDDVPSLSASTFSSQPGNSSLIILGTGEPRESTGSGLYRTTNGGTNWTRISLGNTPVGFYKIRFDQQNRNVVHAAGTNGYYRSDDAGLSWKRYLEGEVTDVALNPNNTKIIYCGKYDNGTGAGGAYKSIDGGNTWFKMRNDGLPTSNVGRTSISVCASNPNVIYMLMGTDNPGGLMLGVYRSFPNDTDFIKISPPKDILGVGFGWYVHAIAVSPTNPAVCLVGGIYVWRTSDFGRTWKEIQFFGGEPDTNMHSDIHSIVWDKTGNSVWVGNDGGTAFSDQQGLNRTFNTTKNIWPITQYAHFDICLSNPKVMYGGSRDNGITGTTNGGISWSYVTNGPADGGGIAIDPTNPEVLYSTLGEYTGNWRFRYFRSSNSGINWDMISNGIAPTNEFYTEIRTNNIAPIYVYTQSKGNLYFSVDRGTNWILRNTVSFNAEISDFDVHDYNNADTDQVIYVALKSGNAANRIKFQQNRSNFHERSSGIPGGLAVRKVIPHPTNINVAYALISDNDEKKMVYRTVDKGISWTEIDGNLPDLKVRDLAANPYNHNILYLGTETGCFKTTNGGTNWFRWNDGMPIANRVSEMKAYQDNGKFIIAAATYGRGIWTRDETSSIQDKSNKTNSMSSSELPVKFELYQNYPNPFNPSTKIKFDIPKQSQAKITVYDIAGKEVSVPLNEIVPQGSHEIEFNAYNLSSGVYFYKITAGEFSEIKKMILIK